MKLGTATMMSGGIPSRPGTPFGGGYYVGRMAPGDGNRYALIVAPKNGGETTGRIQLRNTTLDIPEARNSWDGAANMAAMLAVTTGSCPAAIAFAGLTLNGFSDWVIPARYQLEMCYRAFKRSTVANDLTTPGTSSNQYADPNTPLYTASDPAQTSLAAFQIGGSEAFEDDNYWSSTTYPTGQAWCQDMNAGGMRNSYGLSTLWKVRGVRMIKI